jgi:AcrR family transcriptional regulator
LASEAFPREELIEIQRSRLLNAAVHIIDERGYAQGTVAHITRRARVSRRTFYELFANREACLLAVIDRTIEEVQSELAAADLDRLRWRERVRAGLTIILGFLDRQPALARACIVQAPRGGQAMLERRESVLAHLARAIDAGRAEGPRGQVCTTLTAEGLVGAAYTIVHTRLLRDERESLTGLLGELTAMIALPYLGPAAARREQARPVPQPSALDREAAEAQSATDPLEGLAMRMTYRTARVLEGLADRPGASNRLISEYAEIHDQGQVSKLLSRLARLGLLKNEARGHANGEPNAWALTNSGERVARSILIHNTRKRQAA